MITLLDKKQAGDLLGVRPVTIDRLRKAGKLPYRTIGNRLVRFTPEDIEEYLKNTRQGVSNENPC